MQTYANRLNPDSHHLIYCFIYYKHSHDFGSDGQNCHTREFNDHLLQPFEIADFSQYPQYLIDQEAGFLKSRSKKLPSSHCIRNRNEAI